MVKEKALEEKMNLLERCEVAKSRRQRRSLKEESKTGGIGEKKITGKGFGTC